MGTRTLIKRLIVVAAFLFLAPLMLAWEGVWSPADHPILLLAYRYLSIWQPLIAGVLAVVAAGMAVDAVVRSTRMTAKATLRSAQITARATIKAGERAVAAAAARETARQKQRDERDRQDQTDIALDALGKLTALIKCLPTETGEGEPQFLVTGPAAFPGLSTIRLNGVEMRIRQLGIGISKEFAELEGWVAAIVADRETRRDRADFRKDGVQKRAEAERLRDKIQGKLRFGA